MRSYSRRNSKLVIDYRHWRAKNGGQYYSVSPSPSRLVAPLLGPHDSYALFIGHLLVLLTTLSSHCYPGKDVLIVGASESIIFVCRQNQYSSDMHQSIHFPVPRCSSSRQRSVCCTTSGLIFGSVRIGLARNCCLAWIAMGTSSVDSSSLRSILARNRSKCLSCGGDLPSLS